MSLKAFHFFFIAVSAILSVFMVLWGVQSYRANASAVGLGVGLVGAAGLAALLPYFRWVQKKFRKLALGLTLASAIWLTALPAAEACSVCFGDPESLMTKGLKAGIILLVLVVGGVLAGISAVAFSWGKRAKAFEQ